MRTSRGFSLIEIVISIFIVSVMLLLLQAVVRSGVVARATGHRGVALTIAHSEIERLRAGGYASLPPSGSFSDSLLASLPEGSATLAVSTYDAQTKQVVVQVLWQEPIFSASSTVSLTTLVTETGGLP
jgi:prepilin-type N-terminal cleavage/methylation domain-containing protein